MAVGRRRDRFGARASRFDGDDASNRLAAKDSSRRRTFSGTGLSKFTIRPDYTMRCLYSIRGPLSSVQTTTFNQ